MSNDANQKTYFSTINETEQIQLLECLFEENIDVYLWEEGQDEDDLQEFNLSSKSLDKDKICLGHKGKILTRLLSKDLSGKDIYLKATYQKIQYFTHGELTHNKVEDLFYFRPKHDFYKGQQRSNYRLAANAFIRIQVKLDNQVYECHDISASGISLMLTEKEPHDFTLNKTFSQSTVRLGKQDFIMKEVQVKGIFSSKQRKHIRKGFIQIGMAFTHTNELSEEGLFLAINSEARSSEMRKKFGKGPK